MEPQSGSPSSPDKPSEYNNDHVPTPSEDTPPSDKPSEHNNDDDDVPTPSEDAPPSDKPSGHDDNDDVPTPSADTPSSDKPSDDTAPKLDKQCSISSSSSPSEGSKVESFFQLDAAELSNPLAAEPDNAGVSAKHVAEADKPAEWVAWMEREQQAPAGDVFFLDSSAVFVAPTQPPEVQMMAKPEAAEWFDPERIPSAIFQAKSTGSAEWSVASNESLFSIHGASQSSDLAAFYTGGMSPFDYFYDEAMAAGGLEPEWKLPTVAEAPEAGDVLRPSDDDGHGAKDFALPGSLSSDSSGSAKGKKIVAFRHDSSSGSSSNFSFAFPILAETSPKNSPSNALYQPLQKESEEPPRMVTFQEEMREEGPSTEKGWCVCWDCCCWPWKGCCLCRDCCCWPESGWCLCRDCCCWFPCSWRCCFPWWCCCDCDCHCHFPSCRCRCCPCF